MLENIKVGDKVYQTGRYGAIGHIIPVEKITKTMIIANGYRFNRKTGNVVGGNIWETRGIEILNSKTINEVNRKKRLDKIKYYNFDKLDDERLEKIIKIIGG